MSNPQNEAQQAYQTYTHLYQVASQLNAQAKVDPSKADQAQAANQQAHTAYAAYQAAWSKAYQEHNKQAEVVPQPVAQVAQPVVAQPMVQQLAYQQPVVQQSLAPAVHALAQPAAAAPTAQLSSTQLASLFPTAVPGSTPTAAVPNPLASLPLPTAAGTTTAAPTTAANPMAALAALPGFQQLVSQQIQQATLQAAIMAQGALGKTPDKADEIKKQGSKRSNPEPITHPKKQFPKANYGESGHDDREEHDYDAKKEWNQGGYGHGGRPDGRKPYARGGYSNNYHQGYGQSGYENGSGYNNYSAHGTETEAAPKVDRFGNKIAEEHGSSHFNRPAKDRLGARAYGTDAYGETTAPGQAENKDYTAMSTDTVYVEGLPIDVDRSTISDFFSQVGPLRTTGQTQTNGIGRLFVFKDEDDRNKCNGAASVTFQNAEDAENCCSLLQGKSFPVPKENYENLGNSKQRKRNDSDSSTDDLNRERSAMRSERSDSSDDDDDRDYKRRKRNSSSSNTGKQSNFVNDPTSTIQNANRSKQPLRFYGVSMWIYSLKRLE